MMNELLAALAGHRGDKARRDLMLKDHNAREAMLDAYWLHYWDEDAAWNELVHIVADYTRETPGVKAP